jgi:hypothetical protein
MKKILTLALIAGTLSAAQAQTSNGGYGNNRDVILGGGNGGSNYPSYPRDYPTSNSRQAQIDQTNREYDDKIQSIRNNSYLSYDEKQRSIRQLEKDRQRRIETIGRQYSGNDKDNDNPRGNKGKHKGWNKKNKNGNWKNGQYRD